MCGATFSWTGHLRGRLCQDTPPVPELFVFQARRVLDSMTYRPVDDMSNTFWTWTRRT